MLAEATVFDVPHNYHLVVSLMEERIVDKALNVGFVALGEEQQRFRK